MMSVSVYVYLYAGTSSELHGLSSPNFFCLLPVPVAQSSSGGVVILCIFPVLWMTSYLYISSGCSTLPQSEAVKLIHSLGLGTLEYKLQAANAQDLLFAVRAY